MIFKIKKSIFFKIIDNRKNLFYNIFNMKNKNIKNNTKKREKNLYFSRFLPTLKNFKGNLTLAIFLHVLFFVPSTLVPFYIGRFLAHITELDFSAALTDLLFYITLYAAARIIGFFCNFVWRIIAKKTETLLRKQCAAAACETTVDKYNDTNTGIFLTRLSSDPSRLANITTVMVENLLTIISGCAILIFIFALNVWFGLACLVFVVASLTTEKLRQNYNFKWMKKYENMREENFGLYTEAIRGMTDLKTLGMKKNVLTSAESGFESVLSFQFKKKTKSRLISESQTIGVTVLYVGILVMGALFIQNNLMTLTSFIVIYSYHNRVVNLPYTISALGDKLNSAKVSANRVYELIDDYPKERFGDKEIKKCKGVVEFDEVSFSYLDGNEVLENFSLKIEPNLVTAIVGKSGSGKSTILNLVSRLYDVGAGEIKLDGINIKDLSEQSLRGNVGIVSQNPYIYNLSVRDNLTFVKPDATEKQIENALKKAQIYDFFMSQEKQLDTIIGENGIKLSGGQRQRLAIARLLLKNTKVIVLDEATSSLDNESQHKIVSQIQKLKRNHTIIIVAHRLSTIVNADKIVMIDKGQIIAEGKHDELMKTCPPYRRLYKSEELSAQL